MINRYLSIAFGCLLTLGTAIAQPANDLLNELADEPVSVPVGPAFKATRIIQGHSVQMVTKKHLDFMIQHRFGALNSGAYNFYGLDVATIRLGFDYGLTDNLNIGVGRSSFQKTLDGYVKWRFLRQTKDNKMPVSVVAFASTTVKTLTPSSNIKDNYQFSDRMVHAAQLIIARKFSERLSLQLTPSVIHNNLVADNSFTHTQLACGIGGRIKLNRSISFNAEWFPQLPDSKNPGSINTLSLGFDIETGGHVFQLHFTNSQSMIEKGFITQTAGKWDKGDIFYGFNISRTFSFD
jgi:hypothetical protein